MVDLLHILDPDETIAALQDYLFPPYITLAHLFNAPAGWRLPARALTQHQFQYVLEGEAEYVLEGEAHATRRGDLVYHAPGVAHQVRTSENAPYICISVVFHFGSSRSPLASLFEKGWHVAAMADTGLERKLSSLVSRYHQPGLANQLRCQSLLLEIVHDLHARAADGSRTKVQEKTKAKLVLIRNHIARHFASPLSHDELERVSGLSRNYIIAKFREAYGMTPFEYLAAVRVGKAKELALQTDLSIGEIARLVGYSDVHTFGRAFKNRVGTSLSRFCASLVTN
ncbi:AraC family transcriptional regulator [Paenibacillus sp.]|uniref:AraC family transcriptional regulator n=1 Tax=Paenibacillus sp. TaxID=58172 RepID=UPI002D5859A0|nr:AraC family transcriptional regulator [Paenibacillus sp.]HZG56947.1 AraC family transcriptional regulator [Paenibacillus sp.]